MLSLAALWGLLRGVLFSFAAVVLFVEEWGWRPLTAWAARLATWPPIARLEAQVVKSSPRVALVLFMVPAVLLLPVKLLALWLIGEGRPGLGIVVILFAKLLGTALVGRLFVLLEPQLMRYAWFARALGWWRATRLRMQAAIHRSVLWRSLRLLRRRWRVLKRRKAG